MNKIKFRCPAVTTSVPGGNVAQCDLEFEHDEEKHSVCFGHGAYSFWTDDEV